ncbi:MAG TPA: hypothetical protein DHW82_10390 [Spirochaetia bacterium]|nr:MAG: hypothetical protein A2Y41_00130 [Spirochaetes bacterium GWB1_36_13]HCL57400.1 hypothetical protein [Spirochaetia bacterium]
MKTKNKSLSVVLDEKSLKMVEYFAENIHVSKSWVINQAVHKYFKDFEETLSDQRIASLSKTISHEEILKEYGL